MPFFKKILSFTITLCKSRPSTRRNSGRPLNRFSGCVYENKFNNAVNRETVIPGQTLRLVAQTNPNAPLNLNWIDDNSLQVTSVDRAGALRGESADLRFRFVLIGTDVGMGGNKSS